MTQLKIENVKNSKNKLTIQQDGDRNAAATLIKKQSEGILAIAN